MKFLFFLLFFWPLPLSRRCPREFVVEQLTGNLPQVSDELYICTSDPEGRQTADFTRSSRTMI